MLIPLDMIHICTVFLECAFSYEQLNMKKWQNVLHTLYMSKVSLRCEPSYVPLTQRNVQNVYLYKKNTK